MSALKTKREMLKVEVLHNNSDIIVSDTGQQFDGGVNGSHKVLLHQTSCYLQNFEY